MKSLQSTMSPQPPVYIHYRLLSYAPEQICLPHHTCMFHCTNNVVYIQTPIDPHMIKKQQHTVILCTTL